ncbi:hypothetical protein GH714_018690 [Hevea brasiliensis]|uniref:Uncharacterized protein n=1 Tax=Hevea brasiliensis TaxID=3981 RepID=A0A6A6LPX9_HEVBR|nr:hypothetical protein GH714_018690 [Hevea brasiliensis]
MAAVIEETLRKEEEMAVEEEDDEHGSKERVLQKYFLQEWKVVKSLLEDIVSNGRVSDPSSVHRIRSIMDKYQQEGQLLEPYLESVVSPLMSIVRGKTIELGVASDEILEVIKPICIIIYCLVTVCGYKAVIKFFPHQVSDLELAVSLLEKCHDMASATSLRQESTGEMEAKCVTLLWLSILVLVPFDISSVDSSIANSHDLGKLEPAPLVLKILKFSKDYLSNAGPMRTMAGLLLSRLLTRPDMTKAFTSFNEWAHEVLSSGKDDVMLHFQLLGVVEALAAIFKAGGRKVLMDVVPIVWNDVSSLVKSDTTARSPLLRKYLVKLTQRIGLTCLPHRSPAWCYVGRTNSLGVHVSQPVSKRADQWSPVANMCSTKAEETSNHMQNEDMDVPEIVEEIIEILLSGLRDTDTVVRWSAAKGIGRVTSLLTSALSEEVLSYVLELFSPGEGDGSWHGACLSLAELARRGLLLPANLPKVVPFVVKALHYDIRRGPHSIGSHVRDAAAYVCWAFGRAYYHTDMRKVLEQLAPHLLTVACYDREVNCRRAAAAAFQENVGRQGNYPHGIDIVNTADYFSLSSRVNSYLHVAVSIVQYEGYLYPFAEELLYNKIGHWGRSNFPFFTRVTVDIKNSVINVVIALGNKQKDVAGIVSAIEKARLYRGKGGEIMRSAVSRFIDCISLCCLTLPEKIKWSLLDTLNDNLRHPNSQIQNAAVRALQHFVQAYVVNAKSGTASGVTAKYLEQLTDQNVAVRRGSALALGVLPYECLADRGKQVLLKLCSSCAIEDNPEDRDAEARVNAVKGLISVCKTLTQARECSDICSEEDRISVCRVIKDEVMPSLFKALEDYSVDNRGDVGSWVREAAMEGLETCTYILCFMDSCRKSYGVESLLEMSEGAVNNQMLSFFDANLAVHLIEGIVKQAVEKMDKIREAAAKVLQRILYNRTIFVPFIPLREKLEEIVPNEADLKWGAPSFSYPRFIKLLKFSCYSRAALSGLVISIGGLQDSLRKVSFSALLDYLQAVESEDPNERRSREYMLSTDILWVLEQYKKCDRVIIPTLKTIEILFSKKIFLNMEIRKASAEQVYLVLLQKGNLVPADMIEKALEIISDTCWDGDIEASKHRRSELCEIAGLRQLLSSRDTVSNKDSEKRPVASDENASYSSLVGSTGF